MIKSILVYPSDKEVLMSKSEEVKKEEFGTDELKNLIQDLEDTLLQHKSGVGISAVQIGVLKRVCLIKHNKQLITMINPKITRKRGDVLSTEGCLSAPDTTVTTRRAQKVWCTYQNIDGIYHTTDEGGLFSIIIQHELEHMDGWCKVFDGVKED